MPISEKVRIGIIGGSGLYHLDHLEFIEDAYPLTPWGYPSDKIHICSHNGSLIAFLARHGRGHPLNPSEVPYQANIAALKLLGVEIILAFSAVGSLREELRPLDFVLPDQAVDRTKGIRSSTFFENGLVGHVEFGDPFCSELADIIWEHKDVLDNSQLHRNKTLVVMEGPAFSTRAESNLYRSWGCDLINMSTLPEAKLAREAEISYQVVCMVTDYDCWKVDHADVTVEAVIATLTKNTENAKRLLVAVLPELEKGLKRVGKGVIRPGMNKTAVITGPKNKNPEQVKKLNFILPGHF